MNLLHHRQPSPALDLRHDCIHLARDGTMHTYPKMSVLSGNAPKTSTDGRTVALYHVNGSDDVHYPVWEMHPQGDELLLLVSGSISVELREGEGEQTTSLQSDTAFIVRSGTWHRLIVHRPSVLIAITTRANTVHAKEVATCGDCYSGGCQPSEPRQDPVGRNDGAHR